MPWTGTLHHLHHWPMSQRAGPPLTKPDWMLGLGSSFLQLRSQGGWGQGTGKRDQKKQGQLSIRERKRDKTEMGAYREADPQMDRQRWKQAGRASPQQTAPSATSGRRRQPGKRAAGFSVTPSGLCRAGALIYLHGLETQEFLRAAREATGVWKPAGSGPSYGRAIRPTSLRGPQGGQYCQSKGGTSEQDQAGCSQRSGLKTKASSS